MHHRRPRSGSLLPLIVVSVFSLIGCAPEGTIVSLNRHWDYRLGFERSYLKPRKAGEARSPIKLPVLLDKQEPFKSHRGFVTLQWTLTEELNRLARKGDALALQSGSIGETARFFLNDVEFGSLGSREPYRTAYDRRLVRTIPGRAFKANGPNMLTVVLSHDDRYRLMMRGPRIEIGTADLVLFRFSRDVTAALMLIAVFVVVGMYHLLLAARRPRDRHNLYFGLFCVFFGVFYSANTEAAEVLFGEFAVLRTKVDQLSLMIMCSSFVIFLESFFLKRYTIFGKVFTTVWMLIAAVDLVAPYKIMQLGLYVWMFSMIPALLYILYVTILQTLDRNKDAFALIGGVLFLVVGSVHDILVTEGLFHSALIAPYTFLVFILGIALVLANRFTRVHNQVEELNASLEIKVKNRTLELEKSLARLGELKQQQDGDYFLTSQLIQPLAGDFSESNIVATSYLIRQKKTFRFRKWESELGGDLCAIHDLVLRKRRYVVFLNGDAMGKSMQGAGGALVLGTVFKSLITRAQLSPRAQELHPEQWLRECLLELQNVFVSFDGRMLISLIVGLVDEKTGFLYYMNAEHPPAVLYSNGLARFLEEGVFMRKIGVEGIEKRLHVKTYQMKPDDAVIIGSDGRDDIITGSSEDGRNIVNEDERAFLRHVEIGEGDLHRIEQSIRGKGRVLDDFTLLRIGYREDALPLPAYPGNPETPPRARELRESGRPEEALELLERERAEFGDSPALLLELFETQFKLGRYDRAAELGATYSEMEPSRARILYRTSFALKKARRFGEAADFGERCRMRKPDLLGNLVNLGDIYRRMGDFERAGVMLDRARETDPNHEQVRKLAERLTAARDAT